MLSQRSRFPTQEHDLASQVARARRQGRNLLDLTQSNPTKADLPYDQEALGSALSDASRIAYRPAPFGLESARTAVASELASRGTAIDPEQIVLTSSTSEAYGFALKLLADAGDSVWAARPSYPLLEHITQLEQVELERTALEYDGAWHHPPPSSEMFAGKRGLFLVNPNNPTGNYLKRDELERLSALNIPIISDEVFSEFAFAPDPRRANVALESRAPLTIVLGGLSKHVGLPQLKLSWMVLTGEPENVRAARGRLEIIADAYLSVASPVQAALERVLEIGRPTRDAILARCRTNYGALVAMAIDSSVTVLPVEGGWYAPLRLPATAESFAADADDAWARALLADYDVVVQPGWLYDFHQRHFLVVSLLTPESELRRGFERILDAVSQRGG